MGMKFDFPLHFAAANMTPPYLHSGDFLENLEYLRGIKTKIENLLDGESGAQVGPFMEK